MRHCVRKPGACPTCCGPPIDLTPYRNRPRDTETVNEVTDLMRRKLAELGGVAIDGIQK
ncbi:MAG: hypothetical protein IT428_23140 [Planctomycetaceae bacterium]|nr:hypothetical protein [Planctomycetaceae bacterium]